MKIFVFMPPQLGIDNRYPDEASSKRIKYKFFFSNFSKAKIPKTNTCNPEILQEQLSKTYFSEFMSWTRGP